MPRIAAAGAALAVLALAYLGAALVGAAAVPDARAPLGEPHGALAATRRITLTSPADTYVDSNHPADNFGSRAYLLAGSYDDLSTSFALVRFALKQIPDGAVVQRAVFRAYYDSYCGNTTETVSIARVVEPWEASTVTWNTRPKYADASSSRSFGTTVGVYYSWPHITSLVRDWVSDPVQNPNHGIALRMSPGSPCRHFASANSSHDPQLIVDVELPTPTARPTRRPTSTSTATETAVPATSGPSPSYAPPVTPSDTPTASASPTASSTATPTATASPSPSPAPTEEPASIGGHVWQDVDADGRIDAGEPPMEAAHLYVEAGDELVAETDLDAGGDYLFAGLEPGRVYRVHVDEASLRPVGYRRTTAANPLLVVPRPGQDVRTAHFGYASTQPTEVPTADPTARRIDVWAMAVEVNQGLQDWVFSDLEHGGDLGGLVSADESSFANPLVPGKPAVVRVYVGLRDSPGRPATPHDGFQVTGRLYVQRAVVGARRHRIEPFAGAGCAEHAGSDGQACAAEIGVFPTLGRQGLNTRGAFDLDLIDARSHWGGTLNFVIPPDITETFDRAGVVVTAEIEPVDRQDLQAADNRFELQLSNVAASNRLELDLVRIRLGGEPARPSTAASRRALEQMIKMTPYDSVHLRRNRTYTNRDFARWRIELLGTNVGSLAECDSLWLELYQDFGGWVEDGDTVFGLTPVDMGLGGCTGLGWRLPGQGGLAFSELPPFAVASSEVVEPQDEDLVGIMAQELYHAHLDRRHVSDDHGEDEGCFLDGAGEEIVDFLVNYDTDCWKPSLHPHGAMGEYPPGYVRIGPDPGGLAGRIYGDRGAFGVRIQESAADGWGLTLYDPCPTGPVDRSDPIATIGRRWDTATDRYRCAVADDDVPHSFMSYGDNPWASEDEFQGVTVPSRDEFALAATDMACGPASSPGVHPAAGCVERIAASTHGAPVQAEPGLLATGVVAGGDQAGFLPLRFAPEGAVATGDASSPLAVRVVTGDGRTVSVPAVVSLSSGHPARWLHFAAVLPSGLEPTRLSLTLAGRDLAAVTASAHAPSVRVLWPNGGERLAAPGDHEVRWSADDPDGDELRFVVESSPDGGATWLPLGRAAGARSLVIAAETGALDPSRNALIRVTATDGLRVARDMSDGTFIVSPSAYLPLASRGARLSHAPGQSP